MSFFQWLLAADSKSYNSWRNGSAMWVSPVGFAFNSVEAVLYEARQSGVTIHNHPEGIKGAQTNALAIFLARQGNSKDYIRQEISNWFTYDLEQTLDEIRPGYYFDVSCQGSAPEAIIVFLETKNYEDAVRNEILLGRNSDTIGCIAGGIAQAYYKAILAEIIFNVRDRLPEEFLEIIEEFNQKYGIHT